MRLATDLSAHREDVPVVPYLAPLLPGWTPGGPTAWDRRFDAWGAVASDHLQLVDVEDADLVVIPTDWYWVRGPSWATRPDRALARRLREVHERARRAGVPVVAFFTGDRSCDGVGLRGAAVAREGGFARRMGLRDLALPAFAEDLVAEHRGGVLPERSAGDRPVVGFCGLAGRRSGAAAAARLAAFRAVVAVRERRLDPSPYLGENLRTRALEILDRSPLVDTNFVVRSSSVFFRDAATTDLDDVRREYVDNLESSDYVLCVRGSGNYSYRLYEALSMGRIPVVVDTDLALPAPADVPWGDIAVWVRHQELDRLPELVAAHHAALDDDERHDLQRRARAAWVEHLSPQGWFPHLGERLGLGAR
ncbi:hypothetical protein [Actinomarinicola tropica]|uniref:RXYLT1 C-terminal domain-containing protein n=1 Tax=Actinomarinicola tropica TaxID=2789776 RepID=A0A5Q2RN43_9ACTN|nr:hypothetical protein [Actinomarinicola tropica]QGG96001.1 hypothetical protein GH723_13335 [Actinomarinicola tropica]